MNMLYLSCITNINLLLVEGHITNIPVNNIDDDTLNIVSRYRNHTSTLAGIRNTLSEKPTMYSNKYT